MTRVTPQQWLSKWSTNLNAAGPYITSGVSKVTVAPAQSAIAAQALMLANLTAAVTSGKWAKNLGAVTLDQWKTSMTTKGIPRIAQGTAAAVQNKVASITTLLNNVDQAVASLASTPRGNTQQNIQRAVTFMTNMSTISAANKS